MSFGTKVQPRHLVGVGCAVLLLAACGRKGSVRSRKGPEIAGEALGPIREVGSVFGSSGGERESDGARGTARAAKYAVGLSVDERGVYISDWPDWFQFAPDAFEGAIADGAIGPANVLVHVLQRALPRMQWPPEEGTPQGDQYAKLVKVVAEWLVLEPEPDGQRLRVVT